MKNTVSKKITIYSLVMALLIVLYHTSGVIQVTEVSEFNEIYFYAQRLFNLCAPVALGFFFMNSGFLFFRNADKENIKTKIISRLVSLGIPFIIWNSIELCFLVIVKQISISNFKDLVLGLTFSPFNGPTWYIFALIMFFLFAPILLKLKKNCKLAMIIFFLLILICGGISKYYFKYTEGTLYWLERIIRYFPAFLMGVIVAFFGKKIIDEEYNKRKVEVINRILSIGIIIIMLYTGDLEKNIICFMLLRILPITIWFSFHGFEILSTDKVIFKISFLLFLMHDILIRILGHIYLIAFSSFEKNGLFIIGTRLMITVLIFCIVILFAIVMKKLFPNVYDVLVGGRS